MEEEKVILVDENDNQIGLMPKMEAHEKRLPYGPFKGRRPAGDDE